MVRMAKRCQVFARRCKNLVKPVCLDKKCIENMTDGHKTVNLEHSI